MNEFKLLKKFDKYVAIERENISKQVKIFNNKIGIIKEWNEKNLEMYLYKNGKLFSLFIENPNEEKIRNSIEKAEKLMKYLPKIPFELKKDTRYVNEKYFDKKVIDNEKIVDKAEEAINFGLEKGNEVAGVLFSNIEKIKIYNPFLEKEDKNSMAYLSIRLFKDNISVHSISCSRKIDGIKLQIDSINSYSKKMVKEGIYNILFSPLAFSNLTHYFASFSSAFAVDAGYSFLVNKIGKKVANEKVTIYDSGIERDGLFSKKFDDEGIATRKTCIVENGILKTYLHNCTTAVKYNTETTGNAGIIAPHPWNIILKEGDASLNELLEEIKEGIFITNVWYTRFHNYVTAEFSTVARDVAFYIKNGEIKHIVEGIRINDNLERIFKNIEMISKERKQIYWWEIENPVFCPYVLVKNVRITTS